MPFTCLMPSFSIIIWGKIREANARRKKMVNSSSSPPIPKSSNLKFGLRSVLFEAMVEEDEPVSLIWDCGLLTKNTEDCGSNIPIWAVEKEESALRSNPVMFLRELVSMLLAVATSNFPWKSNIIGCDVDMILKGKVETKHVDMSSVENGMSLEADFFQNLS